MSELFKCLIELNNCSYRIIIDKSKTNINNNSITFRHIFNEITEISGIEDLSLESHNFEIFDNDFNQYVVIGNESQIMDNLSRIRVTEKPKTSSLKTNQNVSILRCEERSAEVVSSQTNQIKDEINSLYNENCYEIEEQNELIVPEAVPEPSAKSSKSAKTSNSTQHRKRFIKDYEIYGQLKEFPTDYQLPEFHPFITAKLESEERLNAKERIAVVNAFYNQLSAYFCYRLPSFQLELALYTLVNKYPHLREQQSGYEDLMRCIRNKARNQRSKNKGFTTDFVNKIYKTKGHKKSDKRKQSSSDEEY